MLSVLEKTLQRHAHNYYCLDKPEISDYACDLLYRQLQKEQPDSVLLERVGSGICKELHA
jgi:NAD-dependent DNA ligase